MATIGSAIIQISVHDPEYERRRIEEFRRRNREPLPFEQAFRQMNAALAFGQMQVDRYNAAAEHERTLVEIRALFPDANPDDVIRHIGGIAANHGMGWGDAWRHVQNVMQAWRWQETPISDIARKLENARARFGYEAPPVPRLGKAQTGEAIRLWLETRRTPLRGDGIMIPFEY